MLCVVFLFFAAGCSYQQHAVLPAVGLPEELFSAPQSNPYGSARVGVFTFRPPSNASEKGRVAARLLCDALEQKGVFAEVIFLSPLRDMTMRKVVDYARMERYDLIITGELLYFFEGSDSQSSRVTEEIRVVQTRGGKPQTLWHARASESAPALPTTDYIFAQGKGAPAPSTTTLMKRNAMKFAQMMLNMPPQVIIVNNPVLID